MKVANVGAMRERVTLYAQTQTVSTAGDITTTWAELATFWARVQPLSATQIMLAGRDDAVRRYEMTIRYRSDVSTNSRIMWRGRRFDVTGVTDETEQRVFLSVLLLEINA